MTATVTDENGDPVSAGAVKFTVTGANSASGSGTTNASGDASFTYTGTHVGNDTIKACFDENGNDTCDSGEASDEASKTWTGVTPPPKVTLAPSSATNDVGTSHTVTAKLTNPGGSVSGQPILFKVTGANPTSGSRTTNASGTAKFSYIGTHPGNDTIKACFDENGNQRLRCRRGCGHCHKDMARNHSTTQMALLDLELWGSLPRKAHATVPRWGSAGRSQGGDLLQPALRRGPEIPRPGSGRVW